jgi:hypothetical protein
MVRPKRPTRTKPKPHQLHMLITPEEDHALADEATRRNCTKTDVIRPWIASLPKGKIHQWVKHVTWCCRPATALRSHASHARRQNAMRNEAGSGRPQS